MSPSRSIRMKMESIAACESVAPAAEVKARLFATTVKRNTTFLHKVLNIKTPSRMPLNPFLTYNPLITKIKFIIIKVWIIN